MSLYDSFRHCLENEVPVVLATVISGPENVGMKLLIYEDETIQGQGDSFPLHRLIASDAVRLLREERSATYSYVSEDGEYEVFIDAFPSPPQLIVVGAGHIAIPLSRVAKMLGYRVIVTDARGAFATAERIPDADVILKGWPQDVLPGLRMDGGTYVVLLSHDAKFDEPTLAHVLPSRARYIGAIGSRRTQAQRFARLREAGYTTEQLARIYGPVGLDIGASSAEETALAIMAEVTAVRHGKSGGFLRADPAGDA